MTYIKWKDEVEGYLVTLPAEEKQRIFSYFSEMYADKRDAGKSEAQIIEEFGAPYDVAKRILDGSKDSAPAGNDGAANVSGGNNYNYNYYNYNYGGAPQQSTVNTRPAETPQKTKEAPTQDKFADGIPVEYVAPAKPAKKSAGHTALSIVFILCLIPLSISLVGVPLAGIIQGFIETGASVGAAVAAQENAGAYIADAGFGLINVGLGFMLLAPFSLLAKFLWKKLTAFMRG